MKKHKTAQKTNAFERFASATTRAAGSTWAFMIALSIVIVWIVTGPIFHYSDTWQLVINTGTTIITFLMVFLIQKSQNKDSLATQIKLNELVAANELASNRIISVEDLTEDELIVLHKYYHKLAEMTKKEIDLHTSHSVDEAEQRHELKKEIISETTKTAKPRRHKPGNEK